MGTYRSIFPVAFYINIAFLSFYGPNVHANILCSTLFFFKYLCHRPSIAVESCVLVAEFVNSNYSNLAECSPYHENAILTTVIYRHGRL